MAVSVKASPVLRGKALKKFIANMEHPVNRSGIFQKCKERSKLFKVIK